MTKSKNLGLNLPSRDNTTDLADINVISGNFETIDNEFENVYNKLNNSCVVNTVSGNPIVLKDSASAPLQNLRLFGKTTQNGTPTPDAPVPLVSVGDSGSFEVGVYGKNLLNVTKSIAFTNADMVFKNIKCPLKKDETYTLSFFSSIGGANYQFTYTGVSGTDYRSTTLQTASAKKTVYTFTPIEDVDIVRLYINGTGSLIECMIEKGGFTGYQEFNKQTLTMPYNLLRIPVLVDYNYIDENGQKYIRDEIDLNKGIFNSRIIKIVLNGSEAYTLSSNGVIKCLLSGVKGNWTNYLALSTHFTYNSTIVNTNEKAGYFAIDGGGGIYLTTDFTTVAEFKTWLQSNNVTIYAVRATPIETPLTETELNAYRQLYTNKPTTTILSEADMEVSYVADTKLYIDNKIAELTALTLEG